MSERERRLRELLGGAGAAAAAPPEAAVPADLAFDDAPLEQLLYGTEPPQPTPANIYWPAREYLIRIEAARAAGRPGDALDLTVNLLCEGWPLPPDLFEQLAQALRLAPDGNRGADPGVLLERLWQLAAARGDSRLKWRVGVPLAYWYEVRQRAEAARAVWTTLADLARHRDDGEDDGGTPALDGAWRYWHAGHWKAAPQRFARAVSLLRGLGCDDAGRPTDSAPAPEPLPPDVPPSLLELAAPSLAELASSARQRGDRKHLQALYVLAVGVAVTEQVAGTEHPFTAACLNLLLRDLQESGDHAGALPLCRRTLELRERVLGPNHAQVAVSLNNLGLSLVGLGQLDEAEAVLLRSVAVRPKVPNPYYWLARLYQKRGDAAREAPAWRHYLELGPPLPRRAEEARARLAELTS